MLIRMIMSRKGILRHEKIIFFDHLKFNPSKGREKNFGEGKEVRNYFYTICFKFSVLGPYRIVSGNYLNILST